MKYITIFTLIGAILVGLCACTNADSYDHQTAPDSITVPQVICEDGNSTNTTLATQPDKILMPTESDTTVDSKTISFADVTFELAEEGANFELYRHTDGFAIYYRIISNDGILMDVGFDTNDVRIVQDDELVQVSYNGGMYCRRIKYYDVEIGRASGMIENPLAVNGDLVAITSGVSGDMCLIVRHIFDPKVYYKAFVLDPKPDNPIQFEAVFTDAQHIQLTYSTSEGMVTKTFSMDDTT